MQFNRQTFNTGKLSDTELMDLYKQNLDLKILGELYKPYMTLVYGVCLKYLRNVEDAKDAVIQIFESLADKLQRHHVANFKSWLHVLTKNFCLMQLRKTQRTQNVELSESFMQLPDNEHHTYANEKEQQFLIMEKCLQELIEEQQRTVRLFYLEEKCYREIAENTGYALDSVRSYIQNGRRNLKICMEKNSE